MSKAKTSERPAAPAAAPAASPPARRQAQEIALAGPRLPYPGAVVEERFGVDRSTWKALCESRFPLAKTPEAIILALAYCRARRLDVMKGVCHIVPMWNSVLNREVETVWPSIAELRTTAFRTAQYVGADPTLFGDTKTETFRGETKARPAKNNRPAKPAQKVEATVTFPEWAQVTVYRHGVADRVDFPEPRIYYREAFGYDKGFPVPNARWSRAPSQMLEKCAEAAALRKAFPEEFGDDWTAEEMEGRLTNAAPPGEHARPDRSSFVQAGGTPTDGLIEETEAGVAQVIVPTEDDDEDDDEVPSLAEETANNPDRAKPPADTPKPAPVEEVEEEEGDPRGAAPPFDGEEEVVNNGPTGGGQADESPTKALEEYLARAVEGLRSSDLKAEADFDDYSNRTKAAIAEFPGVTEDERDDVRARFVSAFLNRKRELGFGRRGR